MDPANFKVVAGLETATRYDAELEMMRGNSDNDLCAAQRRQAQAGREGVEICPSIYGWSVRYDSGLQNFELVASCRYGTSVDGTRTDAIRFATEWVNQSPKTRYAWMRADCETMDDRWPYGQRGN
jgi:hypothetical protein